MKACVLLVDANTLFREAIAEIINAQPDFEVVDDVGDGSQAVGRALDLKPDLVLMDLCLPGNDGLETVLRINRQLPSARIIVLTNQSSPQVFIEALRAGVQGFLLKNMTSKEMVMRLRGAMRDEPAVIPSMVAHLMGEFRRLSHLVPLPAEGPRALLTRREHEVVRMLGMGATDREISEALFLSINTVKSHVHHILNKLSLDSRHQVAAYDWGGEAGPRLTSAPSMLPVSLARQISPDSRRARRGRSPFGEVRQGESVDRLMAREDLPAVEVGSGDVLDVDSETLHAVA